MASMWSDLPGDILSTIAELLNSHVDLLRFRSVCSSWRRFSFPMRLPPLSRIERDGYVLLNENTVYRLSPPASGANAGDPSSGWLIKVSEIKPNTFALLNPLSRFKIDDTQGIFPKHFNLIDCRISEICRSYSLDAVIIVLWNYVSGCDFAVLAQRHAGGMDYWKFGDENWTSIDTRNHDFDDLIFIRGKCFAIDMYRAIVYFDSELNMTKLDWWLSSAEDQQNHLVECNSKLFVVSKVSCPLEYLHTFGVPFTVRIYKVIYHWNYFEDLGLDDKILLLGDDVSLAISTKDFAGCKGKCVILTDDCFIGDGKDSVYGDDSGVYDLENRRLEALVKAQDYARFFLASSKLASF